MRIESIHHAPIKSESIFLEKFNAWSNDECEIDDNHSDNKSNDDSNTQKYVKEKVRKQRKKRNKTAIKQRTETECDTIG